MRHVLFTTISFVVLPSFAGLCEVGWSYWRCHSLLSIIFDKAHMSQHYRATCLDCCSLAANRFPLRGEIGAALV